jgi:hypothetical protein
MVATTRAYGFGYYFRWFESDRFGRHLRED